MNTDLDALRALDAQRTPGRYVASPGVWRDDTPAEWINTPRYSAATELTPADAAWLAAISNAGPGLIDEVERLQALPSQLRAAFQDPAGDWPTSDRDKLRRIAALLGIEIEEPT